jgi:hypothetical protein
MFLPDQHAGGARHPDQLGVGAEHERARQTVVALGEEHNLGGVNGTLERERC